MAGRFRPLAVNLLSAISKQVLRPEGHRIPVLVGGVVSDLRGTSGALGFLGCEPTFRKRVFPRVGGRLEPQQMHLGGQGASIRIAPGPELVWFRFFQIGLHSPPPPPFRRPHSTRGQQMWNE